MLTRKKNSKRYKKSSPYDWSKPENLIKVRFKLWVCYKHASVGKYGLTVEKNTRVYNGYYLLKDYGFAKLQKIIEAQKEDIFNAKIIEARSNEPVYTYSGFVKYHKPGSIEALMY